MSRQIKFRDSGDMAKIITRGRELLGLNNDSAVIRILLQWGITRLEAFNYQAIDVTLPLKYSEIDFFTTTMNIKLKEAKRERQEEYKHFLRNTEAQQKAFLDHKKELNNKKIV